MTDILDYELTQLVSTIDLAAIDGEIDRESFRLKYSSADTAGRSRTDYRSALSALTEAAGRIRQASDFRAESDRLRNMVQAESLYREEAQRRDRQYSADYTVYSGQPEILSPRNAGTSRSMEDISRFFERDSRRYAGDFELYR